MIILGCYWDSAVRELFIEVFDKTNMLYLNIQGHVGGLTADPNATPTTRDSTLLQSELNRVFNVCAAAGFPVSKIHYKGPHREIVQGQPQSRRASNMLSMAPQAELVLAEVDAFSQAKLGAPAVRKAVKMPTGKVLGAANQLVDLYCQAGLMRARKMALYGAMEIGNGKSEFKAKAKKMIKLHLKRNQQYTNIRFVSERDAIFALLA